MPINPAVTVVECKPAVRLGSGRRKGRPRKLDLSPCRSVVQPLKGTEVIHRTRKAPRSAPAPNNIITNYFSPVAPTRLREVAECPPVAGPARLREVAECPPVAGPARLREAAECPPAAGPAPTRLREVAECPPVAGPAPTPPPQGARRRRSCMEDATAAATQPSRAKRSWLPTPPSPPQHDPAYRPCTPVEESAAAAEAAGSPRTPVSPHKIQSLDCEPLPEPPEWPRRAPLSPAALDLNKPPKLNRKTAPPKPARPKKTPAPGSGAAPITADADDNHKLTDYFPIRRSGRRTRRALEEEKSCDLRRRLRQQRDEGLMVALFPGKGRGVVAARAFQRGEFVVEYAGSLVTPEEAKHRERLYAQDQNTGCYMYYFTCRGRNWCIDGTPESNRLGRLVNHSRLNSNCVTRSLDVDGTPRLALIAKQHIAHGQEILYDYGDRSKESLQHHPWLGL